MQSVSRARMEPCPSPMGPGTALEVTSAPQRVRRTRAYRKRLRVGMPQHPAPAVRALWKHSSLEERQAAHRKGLMLLALWLGRKSKAEVASELGLPPLRVWQLSQQALSGMLAGLLKQPRTRRGREGPSMNSEESPSQLKKRIAQLEQENRDLRQLLSLVGLLPSVEESPPKAPTATPAGPSRRPKTRRRDPRGTAPSDRGGPAGPGQAPVG